MPIVVRGANGQSQRDTRPLLERIWGHSDRSGDCWVWTGSKNHKGYGVWTPYNSKELKSRNFTVHRLVYQLTYGEIPKNLYVCHHCDNPPCVRPDHLFIGTPADNVRDMHSKGRSRFHTGIGRPSRRRLTEDQVREIRAIYAEGKISQPSLAAKFDVSPTSIFNIVHHRVWRNVAP